MVIIGGGVVLLTDLLILLSILGLVGLLAGWSDGVAFLFPFFLLNLLSIPGLVGLLPGWSEPGGFAFLFPSFLHWHIFNMPASAPDRCKA